MDRETGTPGVFPIVALTVATVLVTTYNDASWLDALAWGFVVLLTVVVAELVGLTLRAVTRHEICRPEE